MSKSGKGRRGAGLAVLLVALVGLGVFAASASATQFQRPFVETFGSAAQPSFGWPSLVAVDPTSGDVLVGDATPKTISRFNSDGTPSPYAALGTNVIDGKAGPEGKPCAEEPASCDKTPQNGIEVATQGGESQQMAVDPTNGNIYVTQANSQVVDIFSSEGTYLGQLTAAGTTKFDCRCGVAIDAAGAVYVSQKKKISKFVPAGALPVNADNTADFKIEGYGNLGQMALGSGPSTGSIFLTTLDGGTLKIDKETGVFSEFAKGFALLVTVDPTTGNPLVQPEDDLSQAVEFDGSGETAGAELSRLVTEVGVRVRDFAANSSGDVYVVIGPSDPRVFVYGAPAVVPTVTIDPATDVTSSEATLSGTVNPEGIAVSECFFEYGPTSSGSFTSWEHTAPCEESVPTDSEEHTVHATITGLIPNGQKYGFRLAAKNQNGTERSPTEALITARTTVTEPATVTGLQSATLNGLLRPEGLQYSDCHFEWGLTTSAEFEHIAPCVPASWEIPADTATHAVSAALGELQEAATYRYRLVATNSAGTVAGEELTFETFGPPQITALRARDADQDSVTLEAEIDPSGFDTSYRFEWGPTASYGNLVPASFEPIGSGTEPVRVSAEVSGLSTASTYHYRVIASGPGGTTESDDQLLETLNYCGLSEGRCFELVSRADAGPVAIPGDGGPPIDMYYQAATDGLGGLAYVVESGYPDATKGFSVLYRGTRGASGWSSTQLSTPILDQNQKPGVGSTSGATKWLADDLACGFAESSQPLTDDPGSRLLYERGGSNLYRLDPDGSYTAVTKLAPENSGGGSYRMAGASQDCEKVVFSTGYRYPGIAGAGTNRLYEWEDGTLRNAGVVPGPSGEVVAEASIQGFLAGEDIFNAVSEDGSRVFFAATRQTSPNSEEIGKKAIFVREDGTATRDLSLSETSTPSGDATYQWATPDGSRVFFTAGAGLTEDSSPTGTDLYEYDLEAEELTDLSVNERPGGAQVGRFVGASDDGSHVYFIARGQFIPGYGATLEQNQSANTYSLYGVAEGEVSFVGTVNGAASELKSLASPGSRYWTSTVSPDGRYLLFQSVANVTGYNSGGATEAYLYDAGSGSEGTICVSCRPDGQPSVALPYYNVLAAGEATNNPLNQPRFLTVRGGEPRVFFSSLNVLAPGAVEGQNNVYEWSDGQVFRLTSALEGQSNRPLGGYFAGFLGASEDASDVYLVSPETLSWEDPDERLSVYTARLGGGFPEPAPAPTPCDPDVEGSCQDSAQSVGAATPGAASATFSGPGNVKQAQKKKKRKNAKKRGAKKKHAKKAKHRKQKQKRAGANRRAGK